MEPSKNLHAALPPALLARMERAARTEHITIDELVQDAVERRLHAHEWQEMLAFGQRHAASRELTEADVPDAVAEARRENQERRQ